jgi:hypothetical protein
MIRIFVIDDHYLILDSFNQLFDTEADNISVVGAARNADSFGRLVLIRDDDDNIIKKYDYHFTGQQK